MISTRPPAVWIDDSHAIIRRGMAACLQQADFVVRGESAVLSPEPVINGLDVLVFEYAGPTLRRAVRLVEDRGTRLVATVRDVTEQAVREMVDTGVSAILPDRTRFADTRVIGLRTVGAGNVALPADMLSRLLLHVTQTSHLGPAGL